MSIVYLWSIHDRVFWPCFAHIYSFCPMIEIEFNIEFVKWWKRKKKKRNRLCSRNLFFISDGDDIIKASVIINYWTLNWSELVANVYICPWSELMHAWADIWMKKKNRITNLSNIDNSCHNLVEHYDSSNRGKNIWRKKKQRGSDE